MPKATLKDVAKRTGVSYQTVSKVLNQKGNVTAETEERIWEAVRELGYRPNISARNLRTQSSNLIGYGWQQTADTTPHPILNHFLYSTVYMFEKAGYHLLTFLVENNTDTSIYQKLFGQRQVEGFILADTNHDDPRIAYFMENNIPFASFGQANEEWDFCWVDVDGRAGMKDVVRHLTAQGHRRIGLVTWPEGSRAGADRERGYYQGLMEAGITPQENWIFRGDNDLSTGIEAVDYFLSLPQAQRPSAVSCVSDQIAIGAINECAGRNLKVGQDVAITGYDDSPMAQFLHPPLTTVRQPIQQVGEKIVDLLLNQIDGQQIYQKKYLLRPELIVRYSA
jgi:DNA-binding LacI/PurR family transcriptional regulator